jgi:hypothetical protein
MKPNKLDCRIKWIAERLEELDVQLPYKNGSHKREKI